MQFSFDFTRSCCLVVLVLYVWKSLDNQETLSNISIRTDSSHSTEDPKFETYFA